ncbi:MAG: hypothetical protein Q8Q41_04755 [bacterium]|nr:hypothetical protein [bacterium]
MVAHYARFFYKEGSPSNYQTISDRREGVDTIAFLSFGMTFDRKKGVDTVAFLSFGWFLRRCISCGVPTRERVRKGDFLITGFSEGHAAFGKKAPQHFGCDWTPEQRADTLALRPATPPSDLGVSLP